MAEFTPDGFASWWDARAYYSVEALLFLARQHYDLRPTARTERAYKHAAGPAVAANARCDEPWRDEYE